MTKIDRRKIGQQPKSKSLRIVLQGLAYDHELTPLGYETIIHHYVDLPDKLQMEVEYRHPTKQIVFKRVIK